MRLRIILTLILLMFATGCGAKDKKLIELESELVKDQGNAQICVYNDAFTDCGKKKDYTYIDIIKDDEIKETINTYRYLDKVTDIDCFDFNDDGIKDIAVIGDSGSETKVLLYEATSDYQYDVFSRWSDVGTAINESLNDDFSITELKNIFENYWASVSLVDSPSAKNPTEIVGDGLYERFLRNEVKVKIGKEKNLGNEWYFNFRASQGQEFTLEELVNTIIKWYTDYSGVQITLEKIEYSFLDCGNDGSRELAIRIKTPSNDDWTESIIIKEKDGKLETIYSDVGWSRSRICINEYGYIYGDGSGGASSHGFDKAFLDADGKYHYIYYDSTEFPNSPYGWLNFYFNDDKNTPSVTVWALIDETHEYDDNDEDEFENGFKGYFYTQLLHDDSLYEESGEIYEYLRQNNRLPEDKLVTINDLEQMIAQKEKKEGLTEEIKNGKTLIWEELAYTFEQAIP